MSLDPINLTQPYGLPLYTNNSNAAKADVIFVLENPNDPVQPKRSAKALLELKTKNLDIVLLQRPIAKVVYDTPITSELYHLNRWTYGSHNREHDPKYLPWDHPEIHTKTEEAKKVYSAILYALNQVGKFPINNEDEKYIREILQKSFSDREDSQQQVEQALTDIQSRSPQVVRETVLKLDGEALQNRDDKIASLARNYFPKRQDSLMETIRETAQPGRRVFVLCERSHALVTPNSEQFYSSSEVQRLFTFLQEQNLSFSVIDVSNNCCLSDETNIQSLPS